MARRPGKRIPRLLAALCVLAAAVGLIVWLFYLDGGVTVAEPARDVSQDLPINVRRAEDFTASEDGRISYPGAACGIDVSAHQGSIDWTRVKADGVDFAILRIGYRGYAKGGLFEDECFRENLEGAKAAGLRLGVYFFSQAVSKEEAEEEAEYVLSLLGGAELALPVFFDWEEVSDQGSRTAGQGTFDVGDYALAFCSRIEDSSDYAAGVYFNQRYGYSIMQLHALQTFRFWLAEYRDAPGFLYDFELWQYTGQGRVDGIDTVVDLDLLFED